MNKLDHVGIAVEDLDQAIELYTKTLGFELDSREVIESQAVEVAFVKLENTKLEFICPINDSSPLKRFLDKRGPGLHHLCYEVRNIRSEMAKLEKEGFQLIDKEPRPGAHGTEIAFVHPTKFLGVLTELCQYQNK